MIIGSHKPTRKNSNLWIDTKKVPSVTIVDVETPLNDKSPIIVPKKLGFIEKKHAVLSPLKSDQAEEAKLDSSEIS